jgi:hypothetical protein
MNPKIVNPLSDTSDSKDLIKKATTISSVSQELVNVAIEKQKSFLGRISMTAREKKILDEKEQKDLDLLSYELETTNGNLKALCETQSKAIKLALNMILQRGTVDVETEMKTYFLTKRQVFSDILVALTIDHYDMLEKLATRADQSSLEVIRENAKKEVNTLYNKFEAKKLELLDEFDLITRNTVK